MPIPHIKRGSNCLTSLVDMDGSKAVFCHSFDLTKRLASASVKGTLSATPASNPQNISFEEKEQPSAFKVFIKDLQGKLQNSASSAIHRVVIPSLLSPTLYSPGACQPAEVLQFLHALRALLRQYCGKLTALITMPVTLFPRSNGVTRWVELLSDGVLEMIPLPPKLGAAPPSKTESKVQEQSQGILRVHSLPIFHEKGGGGAEHHHFREDLSFHLSGTKGLVIQPYVLPPMEEEEGHKEKSPASTVKDGIDF